MKIKCRHHGAANVDQRRQGIELVSQIPGHQIEGGGQFLELVAAGDVELYSEVALGDPASAFLELVEGFEALSQLADREERNTEQANQHYGNEREPEILDRRENRGFGFDQDYGPARDPEGRLQEQLPVASEETLAILMPIDGSRDASLVAANEIFGNRRVRVE